MLLIMKIKGLIIKLIQKNLWKVNEEVVKIVIIDFKLIMNYGGSLEIDWEEM